MNILYKTLRCFKKENFYLLLSTREANTLFTCPYPLGGKLRVKKGKNLIPFGDKVKGQNSVISPYGVYYGVPVTKSYGAWRVSGLQRLCKPYRVYQGTQLSTILQPPTALSYPKGVRVVCTVHNFVMHEPHPLRGLSIPQGSVTPIGVTENTSPSALTSSHPHSALSYPFYPNPRYARSAYYVIPTGIKLEGKGSVNPIGFTKARNSPSPLTNPRPGVRTCFCLPPKGVSEGGGASILPFPSQVRVKGYARSAYYPRRGLENIRELLTYPQRGLVTVRVSLRAWFSSSIKSESYRAANPYGGYGLGYGFGEVPATGKIKSVKGVWANFLNYHLETPHRSNQDTCLIDKAVVKEGEWVQSGDLLADSASSIGGELSIGHNIIVAYMPWEGFNYEDAILINERLVYEDVYTSIHIERYETLTKNTKLGPEQITRQIPDISQEEISHLDKNGIAQIGSPIQEGSILVGKVTPFNVKAYTPNEKFLFELFDKKASPTKDSSLRAPKGIKAHVIDVNILARQKVKYILEKDNKKAVKGSVPNSPRGLAETIYQPRHIVSAKGRKGFFKLPSAPRQQNSAFSSSLLFSPTPSPRHPPSPLTNPNRNPDGFNHRGYLAFGVTKSRMGVRTCEGVGASMHFVHNGGSHRNEVTVSNSSLPYPPQGGYPYSSFLLFSPKGRILAPPPSHVLTPGRGLVKGLGKLRALSPAGIRLRAPSGYREAFGVTRVKKGISRVNPVLAPIGMLRAKGVSEGSTGSLEGVSLGGLPTQSSPTSPNRIGFFQAPDTLQAPDTGCRLRATGLVLSPCNPLHPPSPLTNPNRNPDGFNHRGYLAFGVTKGLRGISKPKARSSLGFSVTLTPRGGLLGAIGVTKPSGMHGVHTTPVGGRRILAPPPSHVLTPGRGLVKGLGLVALGRATELLTVLQPSHVHIYLAEKRKVQVGDKLSGRHGNKGIVSRISPRQDMPFLPDGTPVDIVLNPLGVPSRMNVGQIYECLLGLAGRYLGEHYKIPPFDEIYGPEASRSFVFSKLYQARKKTGLEWIFDPNTPGKTRLFDGRTSQCFDQTVTVGISYILKLVHMVDDKLHARSVGPYSLVTQQPLRGRSKQGGQRLGEMEVWAIEGYGAAFVLSEMLTIKSDNMAGRQTLWVNLINNKEISLGTPESFKVLVCELQALCLDIGLFRGKDPSVYNKKPLEEGLDDSGGVQKRNLTLIDSLSLLA